MKTPAIDPKMLSWDKYKAFHVGISAYAEQHATNPWVTPPFILFKNGQLMCTMSAPKPLDRRVYNSLNLQLVATGDDACPRLYFPDGEPVTKAWLYDNGQQYLLIDLDTKRAVRLRGWPSLPSSFEPLKTRLPEGARGSATAWFAKEGAHAVAAPIAIRRPFRSLPKEIERQVTDFICSTKAAMALMDHPSSKLQTYQHPRYTWNPQLHKSVISGYNTYTYPPPRVKLSLDRLREIGYDWQKLSEDELKRLFFAGVDKRPRELVNYLLTEPK